MPIAYQDLYLLLRAENLGTTAITSFGGAVEALGAKGAITSRQLSMIGTGLVTGGTVIAAAGAIGLKFFYDAGKAAALFQQQSAYALTQAAGYGFTLQQVEQLGLNVAKTVPTAFDTIQLGLYHIFSTIEHQSLPTYQKLLKKFSQAAVAGNTDVTTTTLATVAEMKAFNIPVKDITALLDMEFQMVKEGRGTYSQFIDVLGTAIPIYAANAQSVKEMMTNFAFMTRSGTKAGSAVASISRAVEAVNKAGFQAGLKQLGISFLDAHGKAKQLDTILQEIHGNAKFSSIVKASGGDLGKAFSDTFGGGTIQARRFFDLALQRWPLFQEVMKGMAGSTGAMGRAYKIMSETTAARTTLMKNNFKALQIEMGTFILPLFNRFIGMLEKVFNWFNNLSPATKKWITFGALFGSIAAVLGGIMMIMTGFFLKFVAVVMDIVGANTLAELGIQIRLVGMYAMDAIVPMLPYIAAIVAIAAAIYLGIKYHKEIWAWMQKVWKDVVGWVDKAYDAFMRLFKSNALVRDIIKTLPIFWIIKGIQELIKYHKDLIQWAKDTWKGIKTGMEDVKKVAMDVAKFFEKTWDAVFAWFSANWTELSQVIETVWFLISNTIKVAWHVIMDILRPGMQIIKTLFSFGWRVIATVIKVVWTIISGIVRDGMKLIMTIIDATWGVIEDLWKVGWDILSFVVKTTWDIISGLIKAAWSIIVGIFTVGLDLLTGHWSKAWNDMKHYLGQAFNDINKIVESVLSNIIKLIVQVIPRLWDAALKIGKTIINAVWQGIDATWHLIYNFFHGIVKVIVTFFAGLWDAMYGIGKAIVEGLWHGITDIWHIVKDGLTHLGKSLISDALSIFGIHSPSTVYSDMGKNMMLGLANGITSNAHLVQTAHNAILKGLPTGFNKIAYGLSTTASSSSGQHITLVNIIIPKGMVELTVSGSMSQAEQLNLHKVQEAAFNKFTDTMVQKIKKVRV